MATSKATATGAKEDAAEREAAMSKHHSQPPESAMKTSESPSPMEPPSSSATASFAARSDSAAAESPSMSALGADEGSLGISANRWVTNSSASPSESLPENSSTGASSSALPRMRAAPGGWVMKSDEGGSFSDALSALAWKKGVFFSWATAVADVVGPSKGWLSRQSIGSCTGPLGRAANAVMRTDSVLVQRASAARFSPSPWEPSSRFWPSISWASASGFCSAVSSFPALALAAFISSSRFFFRSFASWSRFCLRRLYHSAGMQALSRS
mmetsp:Transcript_7037/g.16683  ORF Transcript_7037/g.16683 Transcript_7037/m.16683 type:complete len:270 (-) Transcript_7037:2860-3669(-)